MSEDEYYASPTMEELRNNPYCKLLQDIYGEEKLDPDEKVEIWKIIHESFKQNSKMFREHFDRRMKEKIMNKEGK